MKVLLLGHNGWIGGMMCELLNQSNINYITTDVRPNDKDKFEELIVEQQPTHIILPDLYTCLEHCRDQGIYRLMLQNYF